MKYVIYLDDHSPTCPNADKGEHCFTWLGNTSNGEPFEPTHCICGQAMLYPKGWEFGDDDRMHDCRRSEVT